MAPRTMTVKVTLDQDQLDAVHAEFAAELKRLRAWKESAIEVLAGWDEVHVALGSPAKPGQSIAAASKAEVERLRAALDGVTRCLDE